MRVDGLCSFSETPTVLNECLYSGLLKGGVVKPVHRYGTRRAKKGPVNLRRAQ